MRFRTSVKCNQCDSNLPLRGGNFCSSLFLETLNREEFCLLSFFTWGGPVNLILFIWAGGGWVSLFCWAFFLAACKGNMTYTVSFAIKCVVIDHSTAFIGKRSRLSSWLSVSEKLAAILDIHVNMAANCKTVINIESLNRHPYLIFRILWSLFSASFGTSRCLGCRLKYQMTC